MTKHQLVVVLVVNPKFNRCLLHLGYIVRKLSDKILSSKACLMWSHNKTALAEHVLRLVYIYAFVNVSF